MATALQEIVTPRTTMTEIELTVLDNMRLALYPQEIARAGEHNSAFFRIIQQPAELATLGCRAEIKTADGATFYVLVTDGTFQLTSDITVHGTGSLQLVYGDGSVDHRTQIAQYWVAPSLFAVDPGAPEYQDGLAQLTAKAFADATIQGTNNLVFSNIGGAEVDRVTLPGVDEATLDQTYLRLNGIYAMQGTVRIDGVNRGVVLDASATASAVYTDGSRLLLRRPTGNAEVQIEDNGGDPASRSDILTQRSADLRYLTGTTGDQRYVQVSGGFLTGPLRQIGSPPPAFDDTLVTRGYVDGEIAAIPPGGGGLDEAQASLLFLRLDGANRMSGNLFINGAGLGLVLDPQQTAAVVYADGTLRLRRGSTNAEVTIENNDGNPSSRQPLINQQSGDARYVQRTGGASASLSGNLVINGVSNGVQFSTTAFIYAPAAGLVLRRGLVGNNVYTEANSGDVATRRRLLTEDDLPAPSVNYTMLADITLTGTFQNIFSLAYPIPRGGNSRVQVTITAGLRAAQISSIGMVQVNCTPGTQVENVFAYTIDSGGGMPACSGLSLTFGLDVTGTNPTIAAQIRNLTTTTLVLAGGNTDPERTLVTISDLGAR